MPNEIPSEYVQQLEQKVAVLTQLSEISTVLNSTLQLDTLLNYIMDKAAEITDAESASVLLWNHNTRELFFAATKSGEAAKGLIGKPVPLDSIAGTVLREKRIIQVDDTSQDSRHYEKIGEEIKFITRSLLGVPMTSKEKIIGVLEAVNKRTGPWTEDDQHYLSILAAQAAVAIDSAQLVIQLRKANDDLNQVDKLKSDFIAIASHELRTPLGVIMGYASFLQEEANEEVSEHAAKVMASALQLRRIIEDMINLRYLKQSQSELQRENVAVNQLLDELQRDIVALTEAEGHKLEVKRAPDDTQVYVDSSRVMMAFTNVVNNAVRFTPKGGKITIAPEVRNREVWISITDTGIGLEQDQLDKIFEEFYQVEDHMTRHYGGLGIGLSIARALVKAHGGRIWATSDGLGKGTTFIISLPLARAAR
jgi:signal transduction histidine kinase